MGNEASLEGGEGGLSGLPAGLAPDGKGGFVRVPGGEAADLSQLSEEDRKQLVAAMSRARTRQGCFFPKHYKRNLKKCLHHFRQ